MNSSSFNSDSSVDSSNSKGTSMTRYLGSSTMVKSALTGAVTPAYDHTEYSIGDQVIPSGPTDFNLGYLRSMKPEAANADLCQITPDVWFGSAGALIPCAIQIDGNGVIEAADSTTLQNLTYVRDACNIVNAYGRNDQKIYALSGGGGVFTFQAFSSPNVALGIQLEFGLASNYTLPFLMDIATTGFIGWSGQSVDRYVQLRVLLSMQSPGGICQIPFANRTQGVSTGYHYDGTGGMNDYIVQPAVIGSLDASSLNAPKLTVTVPTTVGSNLTLNAKLITAASPAMAMMRSRLHMLTAGH